MDMVAKRRRRINRLTMSFVKSRGCDVVNRTRRTPAISPTATSSSAKLIRPEGSRYEFTFAPGLNLRETSFRHTRASTRTDAAVRERSLPRIVGHITLLRAATVSYVMYTRGKERSRTAASVLVEARRMADEGFTEIQFLGRT